jgi:glycosyltransferase involved in cell wall biosynthesis
MWKRKRKYFTGEWEPVIVCPTRWLANQAEESDFRKYRIEIIPTGVDTQIFRPGCRIVTRQKLKISENKKVVLFAAVDLGDERKGAKYFFEALKHIAADNWIVLTIGKKIDLPPETEGIGEIRQLGYVSNREEVSRIYGAADIFCIPSLEDNFPTTVLESLACATPVVGFRSGGIPEQVTKDCGIIVPSKDARALGKAITKLLQNDALRTKMSQNCRNRALVHYSIEKFRDGYIKLYHELLVDTKR